MGLYFAEGKRKTMEKEIIVRLHQGFEQSVQKEQETGLEFWLARDLQVLLGYAKWENFVKVIEKAKISCKNAGFAPADHFPDIRKMVDLGSGAKREIEDIALTRYACYLIAQNGDPSKDPVAFAQTYFAVQTRKQEIIEKRIAEIERLNARRKLSLSEKELSGIIYERLSDEKSFARIRSKGDTALFGGKTTEQMKQKLNVPSSRALADFLPTITIKAKDFANEITNFNIKRDDLRTEAGITREHVQNNQEVRNLLVKRNIQPEKLPPAEDVKKIERKLVSQQKKLITRAEPLDTTEEK
jgi:DNA-damage-inducible protein D